MSKTRQTRTPWYRTKSWIWTRDILIALFVVWGVQAWQTRNMIDDDGSSYIQQTALENLNGEIELLFTAENQKPTLVYFFAPWCTVCKLSIGNLDELDHDEVNIVKIALDYSDEQSVHNFVSDSKSSLPTYLGTHVIRETFKISGYPSYYLLDKNNKIVSRSMGYSTELGMKARMLLQLN